MPGTFSFTSLPLEIRRQIYRELAPNTHTSPFRKDGRPCCPAILRTNRAIYGEAIVEWYSIMPYKVSITKEIELLNHKISPHQALPRMFSAIKSLDLSVHLQKHRRPELSDEPTCRLSTNGQLLDACFPSNAIGTMHLSALQLRLSFAPPFFTAYKDQPDQLRRALESSLGPLQRLRGLREVNVIIYFSAIINNMFGLVWPEAPLFLWKEKFVAQLYAFSKRLVRRICAGGYVSGQVKLHNIYFR